MGRGGVLWTTCWVSILRKDLKMNNFSVLGIVLALRCLKSDTFARVGAVANGSCLVG